VLSYFDQAFEFTTVVTTVLGVSMIRSRIATCQQAAWKRISGFVCCVTEAKRRKVNSDFGHMKECIGYTTVAYRFLSRS
jgi:hypothetical protein